MGVGVLDGKERFGAYIMAQRFPVPVGYDEDGMIARDYQVNTLPLTVFIDRKGKIVERVAGMVNDSRLHDAMKKIL